MGESFWPRSSPGPHPGPLPPSGRGGLLVVRRRFGRRFGGLGWRGGFGLGVFLFAKVRFASFAVAWAVHERPLRLPADFGGMTVTGRHFEIAFIWLML